MQPVIMRRNTLIVPKTERVMNQVTQYTESYSPIICIILETRNKEVRLAQTISKSLRSQFQFLLCDYQTKADDKVEHDASNCHPTHTQQNVRQMRGQWINNWCGIWYAQNHVGPFWPMTVNESHEKSPRKTGLKNFTYCPRQAIPGVQTRQHSHHNWIDQEECSFVWPIELHLFNEKS